MESNMVNEGKLEPNTAIAFIGNLFKIMLPKFKLIDSKNMGLYYYAQVYGYNEIKISLGCERGYLESSLKINNKEIDLNLPDDKKILQPNETNFRFILNFIRNRIKNIHPHPISLNHSENQLS